MAYLHIPVLLSRSHQSDPSELHEPAPLSQNQADYVHVPPIQLHGSPHQPLHQTSSTIQQPIQNPIPQISSTPTHNNVLTPIALFSQTTSGATMESKAKQQEVLNNVSIECSIDSLESTCTSTTEAGLQTKASKLFHKIIGHSEDLLRFDMLRIKFKNLQQQNKTKPTTKEKNEYETLLVKLQSRILSIKYVTKDELKTLEEQYMARGGLETDHLQSSTEYQELYKKLQLIKKVLSIWKTFEI